jgi:3-keto-5-aminohexanoate cleavage enzyme
LANTPIVIVAAVNGGYKKSTPGSKVPMTPKEIADTAVACREAGASVLHFHARDEEGIASGDPELYRKTIRLVRERTDILIQTTNGIGARKDAKTGEWIRPTDADRFALLDLEPRPDLFGAAIGTMDFYHPHGGNPVERAFPNSADWLCKAIRSAHEKRSTVEFEVVYAAALHRVKRFADEGVFNANADYLWLLHGGGFGGTPSNARMLVQSIEEGKILFPNAKVGVVGTGPDQFKVAALGLACECDTVRVGLEDSSQLPDGSLAPDNQTMVAAARDLAAYFGRSPASPQQARDILGLNRASR